MTETRRTKDLPDVSSIDELDQVLKERFAPKRLYRLAHIWMTPEELCEVAGRYASVVDVRWAEYGPQRLRISFFWREPRDKTRMEFIGFHPYPTPEEAIEDVTDGWGYDESTRAYRDALPWLAGLIGRSHINFRGDTNYGLMSDYDKGELVRPADLEARFVARAEKLQMPWGARAASAAATPWWKKILGNA